MTICIYLNSSNNLNEKKFYNKIQPNFDRGAKFLFEISSSLDYHNNVIKFFIKNGWTFPENGIGKLFIEINNSEDLNQFIELLNQSLDYNDDIFKINQIIGSSLLDKIVDENYIKQFKSEVQGGEGLCWAYSLSAIIYLNNCSIFGRKIQPFKYILKNVVKEQKRISRNAPVYFKEYPNMIKEILKKFKLKSKDVEFKQARFAVMKGRPCLCIIRLEENSNTFFKQYFQDTNHKNDVFTKEILTDFKKKKN